MKNKEHASYSTSPKKHQIVFAMLVVLLMVGWLYAPFVSSGLPYFYDEDEGHHFNRVVNMVQEGSFNPKYFLKPSLHFYLRMPVTAAAFLRIAKKGEISSIQEIRTTDPYGLAGMSFTPSHPFIAKANRAFSLFMTLAAIALVILISLEFTPSLLCACFAALLTSLSPTLAERSAFIGVDGPMMLFSLLTVYLAILLQKRFSYTLLIFCAISAGLTVSTKYNAAPIFLLPCLALFLSDKRPAWGVVLSIILPPLAFLAASPFILVSIPLFLDHVGYEMWHYKTGHIGHEAEAGLAQLLFYSKWLWSDGWNIIPLLSVLGFGFLLNKQQYKSTLTLSFFPIVYTTLMLMQRVNFTRNLIIVIPFLAIFASCALYLLMKREMEREKKYRYLCPLIAIILSCSPLYLTLNARTEALHVKDSRTAAHTWLLKNSAKDKMQDTAISGRLQLPLFTATTNRKRSITLKGVARIDEKRSVYDLYLDGFDRIVFGPEKVLSKDEEKILEVEKIFSGDTAPFRIPQNPQIRIFKFNSDHTTKNSIKDFAINNNLLKEISFPDVNPSTEDQVWLQNRLSILKLDLKKFKNTEDLALEVLTPWQNQTVTFRQGTWQQECTPQQGKWSLCKLNPPHFLAKNGFLSLIVEVSEVHAPLAYDISKDNRRLGVALKTP